MGRESPAAASCTAALLSPAAPDLSVCRTENEDRDRDIDRARISLSVLSISELDDDPALSVELDASASAKLRSGKTINAAMNAKYPNLPLCLIRLDFDPALDQFVLSLTRLNSSTIANLLSRGLLLAVWPSSICTSSVHGPPYASHGRKIKGHLKSAFYILSQLWKAFTSLIIT
jgi:hypothetical protein